jgi:hypothetical protein
VTVLTKKIRASSADQQSGLTVQLLIPSHPALFIHQVGRHGQGNDDYTGAK